ncbi:MAG TPA: serine hydrolase [Gemmatimonadales bacterium]|jgi:CubicO group peptidase (beta-lactamase class C family)
MRPCAAVRPGLAFAAACLLVSCESHLSLEPGAVPRSSEVALSGYFPPPEASGGWRKRANIERIRELGIDRTRLDQLGQYLMSQPFENYKTGVAGYDPSNKAAIVVKGGWIVGEYYNQTAARQALYYLASNGKTMTLLLVGHMAQTHADLALGLGSPLYDPRWLPEGFPLSDSAKSAITFDQVFRHASGIIPQDADQIADGAVQPEKDWNFRPFTVGKDAEWPQSAQLWYPPDSTSAYPGDPYSSVAFNHFSLIFKRVSGLEASAYLQSSLLTPIGVGKVAYKLTTGMGNVKFAAAGNVLMGARDFMRIGYLMLHEGDWKGNRIFPAEWLRQFTESTAYRNLRSNRDCTWGARYPADLYRTTGSGQNWVLVVPSLDLLLTFNGRTPASRKAEIDQESLARLFAAVTEPYVACDGTLVNGDSI